MNATFSVLSALGFILSIAAALFAARNAIRVQELQDQLARLPVSRLQSLAAWQSSASERLDEQQAALANLANRWKMSKVRQATEHVKDPPPPGEPDPYTNPDEWRKVTNARLAKQRFGL